MKTNTISLMTAVLVSVVLAVSNHEPREEQSLETRTPHFSFDMDGKALQYRELSWEEVFGLVARDGPVDNPGGGHLNARAPGPAPEPKKDVKEGAKEVKKAAGDAKTAVTLVQDGVQLATDIATGDLFKGIVDAIKLTVEGILAIFKGIKSQIQADKHKRGEFTKDTIDQLRAKHPQMNFVIIHTKHHYNFPGAKGKDWYHDHHEVPVGFPIGSTIGYEIYGFRTGEFHREGDGGYLNWAWGGVVTKNDGDGKDMVFAAPTKN